MNIKDSVTKYFELTMPSETKDFKPSVEELLLLWKEYKVDSSELGQEFSSHLSALKSLEEKRIVRKIIQNCSDMSSFASDNIKLTSEVIATRNNFDTQSQDAANIIFSILSIFSGKPTDLQKKEKTSFKSLSAYSDKLEKRFNDLNNVYLNYCAEAEAVFFNTFKGEPI